MIGLSNSNKIQEVLTVGSFFHEERELIFSNIFNIYGRLNITEFMIIDNTNILNSTYNIVITPKTVFPKSALSLFKTSGMKISDEVNGLVAHINYVSNSKEFSCEIKIVKNP